MGSVKINSRKIFFVGIRSFIEIKIFSNSDFESRMKFSFSSQKYGEIKLNFLARDNPQASGLIEYEQLIRTY